MNVIRNTLGTLYMYMFITFFNKCRYLIKILRGFFVCYFSESLDILTVRRLFIFLKENLIFESMQDDLMERNLLNEREQEDCNSRNRYFRIEALLKIIMRKRRCKEFVAFIHEIPGEKHVSEKIVQFQKEQIEQERERQTGSMGNAKKCKDL